MRLKGSIGAYSEVVTKINTGNIEARATEEGQFNACTYKIVSSLVSSNSLFITCSSGEESTIEAANKGGVEKTMVQVVAQIKFIRLERCESNRGF